MTPPAARFLRTFRATRQRREVPGLAYVNRVCFTLAPVRRFARGSRDTASFDFSDFPRRPTTGPGSGHATRDRFSIRATGRLPPTTRRRTRPPGGWGRSRTVRDVTRQTPRIVEDFPKSGRPSVRQSRREALCSPGTNRLKRFPTATRLAPRPPDPLRFLPPDSDPQKSGSRVARVRKGSFDLSAKSACGAGLAASAFVPAPVGPTLRRTSVTLQPALSRHSPGGFAARGDGGLRDRLCRRQTGH